MIDRADTDRDGLVSFEEFYTILTRKIKDWLISFMKVNLYNIFKNNFLTIK
jgi:hypothetical protein